MANRDLNRLKVVLAEKKRTNRWLAAELFRHDQNLCVIFFVSLHKTIPPTKKKTRATSEGIPSSIVIISAIWDFEKSNKKFKLKIVPIVSIVFKPDASEKRKQVTVYNIFAS